MISLTKYKKTVLLLVLALLLSIAILSAPQRKSESTGLFRRLVFETMVPLQKAIVTTVTSIQHAWHRYVFLVGMEAENRELRSRVTELDRDLNIARETRLEYDRLRLLMGLQESSSFKTQAARVIARDRSSIFKTLVIDRGSRHGISIGSPVLVSEGVVGTVMEMSWNASKVLLITDYNCRIDAYVQRSRVRGILEGHHGSKCSLKYVTRAEPVEEGDIIVTSGLAGLFPKGLVLGTVTNVIKGPENLFQEIRVQPAANIDRIEEVLVVIDRGEVTDGATFK
ncbi:MAG: rod shape-determining protein MreC [Syntrophales bacterium]|nr:rod shape-determining protein MreC [Syntrophales bacterium]